ncbi:MBL fold metallo-hydrolase [Spiroplasma clarkii]|uniref:Beta-lactamase n=1 Tax=Spiroplasma clarkii TaxID=2139 RepID=A0A2K8KG56_9MOLU|nr:MBL fold metallo-hydrolase [Spiroplasma clarkii]ATX70670.1 beta-lactamase [Spiroplasma clarkii]
MEIKTFSNQDFYETNAYLIVKDKKAILIDCANQASEILKYLQTNKIELTHILITHGHYNHILGLEVIKEQFASAAVFIGQRDIICLYDCRANLSYKTGAEWEIKNEVENVVPITKDSLINIDGIEFRLDLIGGYTRGSIIYKLMAENMIFCGDTIYRTGLDHHWTDLKKCPNRKLKKSIRFIYKNFNDDCLIFPGHGEAGFTLGEVKNNNIIANKLAKYVSK